MDQAHLAPVPEPAPWPPKAPAHLRKRGRALFAGFVDRYRIGPRSLAILTAAAEVADEIEVLRATVAKDGPTVPGSKGQPVAHPALAALDRSRARLEKLLGALDLPDVGGTALSKRQSANASSRQAMIRADRERRGLPTRNVGA